MSAPEVYEVPQPPVDAGEALAEDRRAGEALWRVAARRLVRNPPAILGVTIVVVFVLVALAAPWLA